MTAGKIMTVAAIVSAIAAAAGALGRHRAEPPRAHVPAPPSASALPHSLCPPGSLPDRGVCIPVPSATGAGAPQVGAKRPDIPRRPGRPEPLDRYAWPVVTDHSRTVHFAADGEAYTGVRVPLSGLVIPAALGAEVRLPRLEGQQGAAEVVYGGDLLGPTLVTKHRVKEGSKERVYLLLLANLQTPPGPSAVGGEIVGTVGDSLSPGAPSLYLEVRRLRADASEGEPVRPDELLNSLRTVSVDPRNLLPLAP